MQYVLRSGRHAVEHFEIHILLLLSNDAGHEIRDANGLINPAQQGGAAIRNRIQRHTRTIKREQEQHGGFAFPILNEMDAPGEGGQAGVPSDLRCLPPDGVRADVEAPGRARWPEPGWQQEENRE